MKKVCVVALVALLLVSALATPAAADRWRGGHFRHHHGGHAGFFIGFGVGALLTAPWWWYQPGYSYPVYYPSPAYYSYPTYYPYPAYSGTYPAPEAAPAYPAPTYPTPQPTMPAPPGGSQSAPPQSGSAPPPAPSQVSGQNCQAVWVEGHYETRVMANGQRVTAWVPAYQVCQ